MTLKPGQIVEVSLDGGVHYANVLAVHPAYREVIAVDRARYKAPAKPDTALAFSETLICPLGQYIEKGNLTAHLRDDLSGAAGFPVFRFAVRDNAGAPIYWWLWDGDSIRIANPEDDLEQFPERRVAGLSDLLGFWGA